MLSNPERIKEQNLRIIEHVQAINFLKGYIKNLLNSDLLIKELKEAIVYHKRLIRYHTKRKNILISRS